MTNNQQQLEGEVPSWMSSLEEDGGGGDSSSSLDSSNNLRGGEEEQEEGQPREDTEVLESDESGAETSGSSNHHANPPTMALPRDHSYLEESHPLLPDADRCLRNVEGSSYPSSSGPHATEMNTDLPSAHPQHQQREQQYPPGPLHDGSSTSSSTSATTHHTTTTTRATKTTHELAVLELHGVVLFPGSTIPVKLQNRSMIRYLGRQIQRCRTDPVAQPRVLVGILPYEPPPPVARERAFGGGGSEDGGDFGDRRRGSLRRWRQSGVGFRTRRSSDRSSWMRQRFSFGNGDIAPTASSFRLRQSLTALRDEFGDWSDNDADDNDNGDTDDEDDHRRSPSPPPPPPPKPSHPLVGRIGTIATVQHTHERTAAGGASSSSSSPWGRYEEVPELVFTAVGTSRFRILSCLGRDDRRDDDVFAVEELPEAIPKRPPVVSRGLLPFRGEPPTPDRGTSSPVQVPPPPVPTPTERAMWNLSQVTPHPYFLYDRRSPWSLVEKINRALERDRDGEKHLPSLGDCSSVANRSKLEPRNFSYWMANNAPFSEGERLKLLKMDSVLERLLYIWKSVEKLTAPRTTSRICCGLCGIALADTAQIFVVGGAEGTTSAYVNGHGFIHQITTLRRVLHEPTHLSFRDLPSTENSYFPGYSWWITCCNRCGSMLGWKFQKVDTDPDGDTTDATDDDSEDGRPRRAPVDPDTPERPPYFYGFMASNVKIISRRNPGGASDRTNRQSND